MIVCTLALPAKHTSKYTTHYKRVAPDARILLIESNVPILVSSYAHQRRQIQCAVSAVLDTLSGCGYLHDSVTTTTAATPMRRAERALQTSSDPPPYSQNCPSCILQGRRQHCHAATDRRLYGPLPLVGVVLDSCPAKGTYWRSYNAMVLSLPPGVASRLLEVLAVHFLLVLLYTWIACGNGEPR